MAVGESCYIENGEKVENALVRHERRLENSHSDKDQRKLVSEEDVWELKFDLDEMQKLFTLSTRPYVKVFYSH
jgi:hypothetical protein